MEGNVMEEAGKMEEPVWEPLLTSKDGGVSGAYKGGPRLTDRTGKLTVGPGISVHLQPAS